MTTELYLRGAKTLLASWEQYARGATGAAVRRSPGVAAAVFPEHPERDVYNNALLERNLAPAERADAVCAMEAACSRQRWPSACMRSLASATSAAFSNTSRPRGEHPRM